MKKSLSIILSLVLVLSFAVSTAAAVIPSDDLVAPCWNYINTVSMNINFDGTVGCAYVCVDGVPNVTTLLEATLTVYEQNGNDWVQIAQGYDYALTGIGLETYFTAESGKTYKAEAYIIGHCAPDRDYDDDTLVVTRTCP